MRLEEFIRNSGLASGTGGAKGHAQVNEQTGANMNHQLRKLTSSLAVCAVLSSLSGHANSADASDAPFPASASGPFPGVSFEGRPEVAEERARLDVPVDASLCLEGNTPDLKPLTQTRSRARAVSRHGGTTPRGTG